jgi:GT2 family glycosyltransferase
MKVSDLFVSIVVYKHSYESLKPIIDSLLALNGRIDWRGCFVDNGGSEWLEGFCVDHQNISYIKLEKNLGYGAGNNAAIDLQARGENYYLICNPDIEFTADSIEKLLQEVKASKFGLYMPRIVGSDGVRQELCKLLPTPLNLFARRFAPVFAKSLDEQYLLRGANYSNSFSAPSLSGCFMLFRMNAFIELGGFDKRFFMYMEDVDLSRRTAAQYGTCYIPNVTVVHGFQRGSYKNIKLMFHHIASAIRYFNKWGWFFDNEREYLNKKCLQELNKLNNEEL